MSQTTLISELSQLLSEDQNQETFDIDRVNTGSVIRMINQQDQKVAIAIELIVGQITLAVDAIVEAFNTGGRLIYVGAGTSGRLGVLDAVECVPTFGIGDGMVIGLIAGGKAAMYKAKEGIEDRAEAGAIDLQSINLNSKDVVVGIAASGRTPYVIGALDYATDTNAQTIALSCNPNALIAKHAKIALLPIVNATNKKLQARAIRMLMQVTGIGELEAREKLKQAGGAVKLAILMTLTDKNIVEAKKSLNAAKGFLRTAISEK